MKRPVLPVVAVALAIGTSPGVAQADCDNPTVVDCIGSDQLWLAPTLDRFFTVPRVAQTKTPGIDFAATFGYQRRPVVLSAPAPDPAGREVELVRDNVDLTLGIAAVVTRRVTAGLSAPFILFQTGAGRDAVSTQGSTSIATHAARDPRISGQWQFLDAKTFDAAARMMLQLPLGDGRQLAGEGSIVFAPSVDAELTLGPIAIGGSLGARLRRRRYLGSTVVGNQLRIALGVSAALMEEDRLRVGVETYALPSLTAQPESRLPDGAQRADSQLPAEWLASLRVQPSADGPALLTAAGGALPLATQTVTRDGQSSTTRFAALGMPALRVLLSLQFVR